MGNKPANLDIGTFMAEVKTNNTRTRSVEREVFEEPIVSAPEEENRVGRRKKKCAINRSIPKPTKFDEEFCQQLALIKAIYKIDLQDFIYVATEKFRDEYFPKGKATKEGLAIISEALQRLNGE